ncbi:MAG: TIGR01212 family radical SAM protein [Candidatus Cryptobacteroides sp.]
MDFPEGKRYNTFVGYYRRKYGERLQKLVLDAGFTCPNRDGTVGRGGCTFCDNAAFHPGYSVPGKSLLEQMDEGIIFHKERYPRAAHYLAYFQSYSNTYADLEKLEELYGAVLSHPSAVGIVIGTRPDCVDSRKLDYLADLARGAVLRGWRRELKDGRVLEAPVVVIEYGIESCRDETLARINRGHDFGCAERAVRETAARGLDTCAHFILGLPGESREMILDQCRLISSLPLRSVKFHQLQIVKGTRMEKEFEAFPEDFLRLGLDDYVGLVVSILERLSPELYIERIAGEVPPRFVKETPWGLVRNADILHLLDAKLEESDTCQGRLYRPVM